MKLIGFATEFYTYWDYESYPKYITDSYGKHHISGYEHRYHYIKNISKSLDKVKELYPDVSIDEGLRGKTRSFNEFKEKLPEGYFWFGKYSGQLIDEVIEKDFDYCVWASTEMNSFEVRSYIQNHPAYKQYIQNKQDLQDAILSNSSLVKEGELAELTFTTNGRNRFCNSVSEINEYYGFDRLDIKNSHYVMAEYEGTELVVEIENSVPTGLGGRYPYFMPVINGKAVKTKGKSFKVHIKEVVETKIVNGIVKQTVKI